MFRRKVGDRLRAWAEGKERVPLLIRGLRQTGKTTAATMFAPTFYEHVCFLDLRAEPALHSAFEGSLYPDIILSRLYLIRPDLRVGPGRSVLIFDEIQDCARARASLRYFRESGKYDVLATGSFLGLRNYNRDPALSIPVGSERYVEMLPLDFEEFLWALGFETLSNEIRKSLLSLTPLPKYIHEKAEELYRAYVVVGGMPDSVRGYIRSGYPEALDACGALIGTYQDDFGRHIGSSGDPERDSALFAKILKVMSSVTKQIGDEKGSFAYSRIEDGARRRSFEDALVWLEGYRLVYRCHLLKRIALPLFDFEDEETFKTYFADTGLLLSQFEGEIRKTTIADGKGIYRGPLYENAAAVALHANGFPLRYYKRRTGLEIDFVIALGDHPVLLEVKARGGKSKSLSTILAEKKTYGDDSIRAIKLTSAPLSVSPDGETIHMPHYCLPYLTPDMDLFG